MKEGSVYIKLPQSVQVAHTKITLEDVVELYTQDNALKKRLGEMVICSVKGDKNTKVVCSAMKMIEGIQKECPGISIVNIGEPDVVIEYKMPQSPKKWTEYAKFFFLFFVVFFGAAFTIMTFNTDVSVGRVFDDFYKLIMHKQKNHGSVLEIAYSVGLVIGILGFYNHFRGEKNHDDPTPIHMEMCTYEEEMNKTIIKTSDREGKSLKL